VNKKDKATATGSKAVYTAADELMVVTGNAKLRTKAGVLSGKVIEYNRRTGDLMAKAAEFIKEGKEEIKPGPKNPKGK
jgi:lipopolysaccharide export system protein LptA